MGSFQLAISTGDLEADHSLCVLPERKNAAGARAAGPQVGGAPPSHTRWGGVTKGRGPHCGMLWEVVVCARQPPIGMGVRNIGVAKGRGPHCGVLWVVVVRAPPPPNGMGVRNIGITTREGKPPLTG